jgi:tetratricopeptide (TPR) repeat protein
MLGAIGKKDDAESALRTAIKLAADDPRPWVALVKLHVRFGNPARAREILTEMKGSIPQSKLSLAMAHCHQILGETAEAEKAYEDALAKHGGDFDMQEAIVHGLVTLHQRTGNASKSEAPLRQILAPGTKASEGMQAWARRNLAAALMFQEGDAKKAEAMQLIGQNLKANPTRAEDLFIQGVLYSHKKSTLEEGIKILERAFRVKPPTADQKFVLVNMYESKGDMQRARDLMSNLVSLHANDEKHPRYVAIYIDKLIQEGKEHKAREWLERLVEVACTDHVDHQRLALAASMLTDLLRRHPQLTREVLPQTKSIRLLASRSGKSGNLLSVAELLGQTGQLELALNLCDDVFKTIPSVQVIDVAVTALSINAATAKDFQRVEGWLEAARKRKPDEAEWDVRLGILKERQGAFAEAESLYRGVLKRDPKDLVAMNNLAFLVGLRGKGNDAHALIQDLIDRIGPAGELLDTRASIRLAQGKFIEAERDLRDAMKLENTAYRQFHLAQVFHAAGKTSDASAEFRKARDLGLNPNMVHPLERASYQALEQLTQR